MPYRLKNNRHSASYNKEYAYCNYDRIIHYYGYILIYHEALRLGYFEIKMPSDEKSPENVCKDKRLCYSNIRQNTIICALFFARNTLFFSFSGMKNIPFYHAIRSLWHGNSYPIAWKKHASGLLS